MIALADGGRTLTGIEEVRFQKHLADCDACKALTREPRDDQMRWIARLPDDAFEDPDLLVLPTIDPIVFAKGAELAAGGMGRITRVRDRRLGRDVALKEVLDGELQRRFEREVMITARLQHPAIVPIYEAGTWPDGSAFYTMRLVAGGTLTDAIDKTTTLEQRLALMPHVLAVTEALAYAHSHRVVHRDLKPSNVLVGEFGETVVIDWGLAKQLDDPDGDEPWRAHDHARADLTRVGSVVGTPCYIAPEQAAGSAVDERADVYSLGALLYHLLAGDPPYWDSIAHDADRLIAAACDSAPTPLATRSPRAPADLRAIAERAMARDPAARYPTAKEMADELRRFAAGQLLVSREYRLRDLLARWIRRYRTAVIIGTIAAVVVAGIGAAALVRVARSQQAERVALVDAQQQRETADARFAALLEEQGREQVLAGERGRALVYLAEAYRRGRDDLALHHLIADASRDLELADATIGPLDSSIAAFGFADDGRIVTIASDTGSAAIAVWDGAKQVSGHPISGSVSSAWLTADTRHALVELDDAKLAMYDTATGAMSWSSDLGSADFQIALDPTGGVVAVGRDGKPDHGTLELRDADTGAIRATVPTDGALATIVFSPDGSEVAAGSWSGTVTIWDSSTGHRLGTTRNSPLVERPVTALVFADDFTVVMGGEQNGTTLWMFPAEVSSLPPISMVGGSTALAVNSTHTQIATGDTNGTVRLWASDGKLIGEAHDLRGSVVELAFSPDDRALIGGGRDRHAFVWDTQALAVRSSLDAYRGTEGHLMSTVGAAAHGVAWSHDGTRLATVGHLEHEVHVWRVPRGDRVAKLDSDASTIAGPLVVTATVDSVGVYDAGTGAARRHLARSASSSALTVQASRDGARVLVSDPDHVTVYDVASGATLAELAGSIDDTRIESTLSRDGRFVMQTASSQPLRVFDAATGHLVRGIALPDVLLDAALAPDGSSVATFTSSNGVVLWNVATGAAVHVPETDRLVASASFDPTGRRLVLSGAEDIVVVEVPTGTVVATQHHRTFVSALRFDDGGHRFATWSRDRTVEVWNLETHALLLSVDEVPDQSFALSGDGARLATESLGGTMRSGMSRARACSRPSAATARSARWRGARMARACSCKPRARPAAIASRRSGTSTSIPARRRRSASSRRARPAGHSSTARSSLRKRHCLSRRLRRDHDDLARGVVDAHVIATRRDLEQLGDAGFARLALERGVDRVVDRAGIGRRERDDVAVHAGDVDGQRDRIGGHRERHADARMRDDRDALRSQRVRPEDRDLVVARRQRLERERARGVDVRVVVRAVVTDRRRDREPLARRHVRDRPVERAGLLDHELDGHVVIGELARGRDAAAAGERCADVLAVDLRGQPGELELAVAIAARAGLAEQRRAQRRAVGLGVR